MELHNLQRRRKWQQGVGPEAQAQVQNAASASIALIEHLLMTSSATIAGMDSSGSLLPRPLGTDKAVFTNGYSDNDGIILDGCIRLRNHAMLESGNVCLLTFDKQLRARAAQSNLVSLSPTAFVSVVEGNSVHCHCDCQRDCQWYCQWYCWC